MSSNSLPFGLDSGREQASRGYSCTEKYEWQQLTFRQREQAAKEQTNRGPTLNYLLHTSSSYLSENKTGGYRGQGHAYHSHSSKRARRDFSPELAPTRSYWAKRRSSSFDRVRDYVKGANGHMHTAVGLGQEFPFNQGNSSQYTHHQEDRCQPTGVDFPAGHFSEQDEERHRSYMDSFRSYNKCGGHSREDPRFYISDHTSAGPRDELGRVNTKRPFDEFHAIHHEQLELSPSEDFHGHLDRSQNCRNAYNGKGKMLRRKWAKQGFQKNKSDGACVIRHGRNSHQKRYGGQLAGKKAKKTMAYEEHSKGFCYPSEQDQQPYLQDEVHHGGSDVMRNDNREGNAKTTKEVGQHKAKGNCHPKKNILTAATTTSPTKSDENLDVLSPKYSSLFIASSNVLEQSLGTSNLKVESDKRPSVIGCTKRSQKVRTEEVSRSKSKYHSVNHMEKGADTKETDNTSPSEVLRDCLILWRRLRKDNGSEGERTIQINKTRTVQTSRVSRNGRSAASGSSESDDENGSASKNASGSSESDDENDGASENSEQCRKAMPSVGVQKHGEGRVKRISEQPIRCLSASNFNKSAQNRMAEQALKCNLEIPQEANPCEITQQKEQDKLSCCLLPAAHLEARIQTSRNGCSDTSNMDSCSDTSKIQTSQDSCSDTSKVDQAAASHPYTDSSVSQKVSQHEANNDHLDPRRKYKLHVSCEIKNRAECGGAKWGEQMTFLSTGPTLLDQKTVSFCSMHDDNVKVNLSNCSNQDRETTHSFTGLELDKGTANNCLRMPVNCSSGSDCMGVCRTVWAKSRGIKSSSKGSDCKDIQWDTTNCNILRNNQVCSALADSENNMHQKDTELDCQPPQALEVTSNRCIFNQCDPDRIYSDVARPTDRSSCFAIPDLNCLPSMITDETNEEVKASEGVVYQVTVGSSKPQNASKSLSAPFSGPAVQEEWYNQPELDEHTRIICEREDSNRLQISNSHSGPPQQSTVEESSTSIDAFKLALYEFIRNILKPLWEDGLISRGVHKMIVKKAADKVVYVLGPKIPLTKIDICRYLSVESQGLEKLVHDYLDVYLGKQVLKRTMPDNI